mmetsp:Transcript_38702/g.83357  ORF Transcript_38702/g.83357 Transcript_38702/m.83357 type:complete len:286 (+) Transcript_38702:1-858(+)
MGLKRPAALRAPATKFRGQGAAGVIGRDDDGRKPGVQPRLLGAQGATGDAQHQGLPRGSQIALHSSKRLDEERLLRLWLGVVRQVPRPEGSLELILEVLPADNLSRLHGCQLHPRVLRCHALRDLRFAEVPQLVRHLLNTWWCHIRRGWTALPQLPHRAVPWRGLAGLAAHHLVPLRGEEPQHLSILIRATWRARRCLVDTFWEIRHDLFHQCLDELWGAGAVLLQEGFPNVQSHATLAWFGHVFTKAFQDIRGTTVATETLLEGISKVPPFNFGAGLEVMGPKL